MMGGRQGGGRPGMGGGGGGRPGAHAKDVRGTLRRLLGLLRPEWLRLTVVVLLGVISVGFLVSGPLILGRATDILFDGLVGKRLPAGATKAQAIAGLRQHGEGQIASMLSGMHVIPGTGVNVDGLGRVLGLAAAVYVLGAVFGWAQGFIMAGVAQRAVSGLRREVEGKLARLPLNYFDANSHGDILSRVTNDIDNLTTTLQQGLSQFLTSVLTILGVLALMFWISPILGAVSVIVIPLAVVVTFLIGRRSKAQFINQWKHTGALNGLVEETHTGHALIQAFGRQEASIGEFGQKNEELYRASFRAQFLSGSIQPAVQFLGNLNYVIVAVLGGYQVATGAISLGAVQAFIQYSRQFTIPITQLASQMNMLQSGLASAERVFELLDAPEELTARVVPAGLDWAAPAPGPGPVSALALAGGTAVGGTAAPADEANLGRRVQLEHVSFRYQPDHPLIEDFTLEAAPAQTVAIVGPTGAGKTTVVNLLMRFYEIGGGRILLDGADYQDLNRDEVRRCFGMVLQDTWMFAGTIRENIAYGREGATDEEIFAAAKAAYVDHFVRTLPDGYDTVLQEDASNISAGQKQLLTIARAFLANPGILILDEATSNVDTRTEVLIQDAMARLRQGRTSFVIAHRLSTIRNADTIVVMDAGHIIEQGSHDELLNQHGFYHNLYNSQFTERSAAVPELVSAS